MGFFCGGGIPGTCNDGLSAQVVYVCLYGYVFVCVCLCVGEFVV